MSPSLLVNVLKSRVFKVNSQPLVIKQLRATDSLSRKGGLSNSSRRFPSMKNSKDSIRKNGGGQFVFTAHTKKMNHRSFLLQLAGW
jgi:hypothetical protein